ncbi:MAG: DHH family phosphoesterase [Muribaculaceae bacterium]|nr:DHH family phosphoesterase [Muribaculaceae bacterium]
MISRVLDEKKIKQLARLIDGARRIVITAHLSPDGDAMGSSLALSRVLSNTGKDVAVIVPDQPLQQLMFLPGAKDVIVGSRYTDFAASLFAKADLIICLDFNELKRIDRLAPYVEASKAPKVMIDHHLHPGDFAEVTISHPEMSSTCMLLFRVLCRLELFNIIDKDAASCLLAGMMTDTGNFAYNANDPDAYIIEAELVRKGADKVELYNRLLNRTTENCLRLTSYALLERMEVFNDFNAALICLTRDELNRFHYVKGDTEGLVNRPLAIPGIVYSAFLREEDGYVKVSMRSLGDFPVNELCKDYFGGGGHLNAAGGEFPGSLEECANLFRSLLKENKEKYIDKNLCKEEKVK